MSFVSVVDGVVVQKQPMPAPGFIKAPDYVVCGYLFEDGVFLPPAQPDVPHMPRVALEGWFKAALSRLGHLVAVNAVVATLPEWKQILWHAASSFKDDDADVVAIAARLNIDLNSVFDEAERIRQEVRA